MRKLVAFLFHAPGLRLFYGERLDPALSRDNLWAIALTLCLLGATWWLSARADVTFAVFLLCHAGWGAYLAAHLPRR
jgi:hypothetical protein